MEADYVRTYANCILREIQGSTHAWEVSLNTYDKHEVFPEHLIRTTKTKKILDGDKIKTFIMAQTQRPIFFDGDTQHSEDSLTLEHLSYILHNPGQFYVSRGKHGLYIGSKLSLLIGKIVKDVGWAVTVCCKEMLEGKEGQKPEINSVTEFLLKSLANNCTLDKTMLPTLLGVDKDFDTYIEHTLKGA
jgi:hypothetical protein